MTTISAPDRYSLDTIALDDRLDKSARRALSDALAQYDKATALLAETRLAHSHATEDSANTYRAAPAALADSIRRGKPNLDALSEAIRQKQAHAQLREATVDLTERTRNHLGNEVRRSLWPFVVPVTQYVALQRASTPATQAVAPHVAHSWALIRGRVRLDLPADSCLRETSLGPVLDRVTTLDLDGSTRTRWVFAAIAAEAVDVSNLESVTVFRIRAEWSDREALLATFASPVGLDASSNPNRTQRPRIS